MPVHRAQIHSHVRPLHLSQDAFKHYYREEVLGLPGPVDHWLMTNSRTSGGISFLRDFMFKSNLTHDANVLCVVERHIDPVFSLSHLFLSLLNGMIGYQDPGWQRDHGSTEIFTSPYVLNCQSLCPSSSPKEPSCLSRPLHMYWQWVWCTRLGELGQIITGILSASHYHCRIIRVFVDIEAQSPEGISILPLPTPDDLIFGICRRAAWSTGRRW